MAAKRNTRVCSANEQHIALTLEMTIFANHSRFLFISALFFRLKPKTFSNFIDSVVETRKHVCLLLIQCYSANIVHIATHWLDTMKYFSLYKSDVVFIQFQLRHERFVPIFAISFFLCKINKFLYNAWRRSRLYELDATNAQYSF